VTSAQDRPATPRKKSTRKPQPDGPSRDQPDTTDACVPTAPDQPPSPLSITADHDGSTVVLHLQGELDLATADQLRRRIRTVLAEHDPHRLLLDLADLTFADSSGLAVLVWAHKQLASRDRQLRLRHPPRQISRLLYITGLDTRLHITE
jgi:anti-anti-sigma factor